MMARPPDSIPVTQSPNGLSGPLESAGPASIVRIARMGADLPRFLTAH